MDINLAIAERAREGAPLGAAELDELAAADVLSLGMLADDVRRARAGATVTYRRVIEVAGAAGAAGASSASGAEVRIIGVRDSLADTASLVRECRGVIGREGLLTGFSLADLAGKAAGGWGSLESVLRELKAAGLDAVAEAPVDQLADPAGALQACADAGLAVGCLSVQQPLGDRRTTVLLAMRELAARFPFITAVAPLPREQSIAVPTTGYDDVRAVALARLALPGVRDIQVDWAAYGPKLAQVALTFGANDLDRVSTVDDPALGHRRAAAEEVRRHIFAAGFTPVDFAQGRA